MNNICIYAEVIALARFFLGFLLSPQILNIQLPSPTKEPGGCRDNVPGRGGARAGEGDPELVVVGSEGWGLGRRICNSS